MPHCRDVLQVAQLTQHIYASINYNSINLITLAELNYIWSLYIQYNYPLLHTKYPFLAGGTFHTLIGLLKGLMVFVSTVFHQHKQFHFPKNDPILGDGILNICFLGEQVINVECLSSVVFLINIILQFCSYYKMYGHQKKTSVITLLFNSLESARFFFF